MELGDVAGLDPATPRGAGNSDPNNDGSPDYSVGTSHAGEPSSIGAMAEMDSSERASL